jgi:hypothetical protein
MQLRGELKRTIPPVLEVIKRLTMSQDQYLIPVI